MEIITFTIVAVALYFFANWVLDRIEMHLGKRLPYRSLIFFAILATLAWSSFALINRLMA